MSRFTLYIVICVAASSCKDQPSESPTARFSGLIAFGVVTDEGSGFIYSDIIVMDGYGSLRWTSPAAHCYTRRPNMTRDGTRLAFTTCDPAGYSVFISNVDGTGLRRATRDSTTEEFPLWSPNGELLAFISFRDGHRDVFVMNLASGEVAKVTPGDASYWVGCWSRDNVKLVYYGAADIFSTQGEVYVYDHQSRTSLQLTTGPGRKMFPALTPDGARIAYQRDGKLHFLSSDGLVDNRVLGAPDSLGDQMYWSSSGGFLVFQAFANGRWDIYRIDREGSGTTNLTHDSFQAYTPVLSPDDSHIAYVASTGSTYKVYIMAIDGSNKIPLTNLNQREFTPTWGGG